MRRRILALVSVLSVFASGLQASDPVKLSRFSVRITAVEDNVVINHPMLRDYCRDQDGCVLSLKVETATSIDVIKTTFFLAEGSFDRWTTTELGTSKLDHDGVDQGVLFFIFGDLTDGGCGLTDGDADGGDESFGFTMKMLDLSGVPHDCVLVIED